MKKNLIKFMTVLCLLIPSCKTVYLPSSTSTTVNVKDSTVFHIKDSVRITERSRYKDYAGLLDTLRVNGNRSSSKSWVDTTRNVLNTELVEEPIEEKTKIIYRDRWKTRDSLVYVEKPVPVEVQVEKRIYPRFLVILSILGVLSTCVLGILGYLKIRGSSLFSKVKNWFSKNHMV